MTDLRKSEKINWAVVGQTGTPNGAVTEVRQRRSVVVLGILFLFVLQSCDSSAPAANNPGEDPIPGVGEIVVFDETASGALEQVAGDYIILTSGSVAAGITEGDILVAVPSEAAPNGFLRRVVDISVESNGDVRVTTSIAYLEELLGDEDISIEDDFSLADVDSVIALGNAEFILVEGGNAARHSGDRRILFNAALGADLSVSGNLSINVQPILKLDHSGFMLEHFEAGGSIDGEASITLVATGEFEGDVRLEIGKIPFPHQILWVGLIPIVYQPVITFSVGAGGSVGQGLEMTPRYNFIASERLIWDSSSGWDHLPAMNGNFSLEMSPVAAASIGAFAEARLDLILYDVAGPYVAPTANVSLDIEENTNTGCTTWEANAGFALSSGVSTVPIFGRLMLGVSFPPLDLFEFDLGEGALECAPEITSVSFPATVPNTPNVQVFGTLRFEDPNGDVSQMCFEVVSGPANGGCVDTPQASGQTSGELEFAYACLASTPCKTGVVEMDAILHDAAGQESEPFRFVFEIIESQRQGSSTASVGFLNVSS